MFLYDCCYFPTINNTALSTPYRCIVKNGCFLFAPAASTSEPPRLVPQRAEPEFSHLPAEIENGGGGGGGGKLMLLNLRF